LLEFHKFGASQDNYNMKKNLLLLIFGLFSMLGYSQYDGKNELKVNFMYLLLGLPEISYERTLKPNTSIGISAAFSSEKNNELEIRWAITPYYRRYFWEGKDGVFFIEGNTILTNQRITEYYGDLGYTTDFGFGVALGGKMWHRNGYFVEPYLGAGVLLIGGEIYPRFGLSLGKRF